MSTKAEQKFLISHYNENDFQREGLRVAAEYRDLGVAEATNGKYHAHVARIAPGALKTRPPSKMHYHDLDFHMVYILKGWMQAEIVGHGPQTMRAGCCWVQPPGSHHKVLAQSEDLELIEVMSPANFPTVNVDE